MVGVVYIGGEKPGVPGQGQAGSQGNSEFLPHPAGLTPSRVPSSPAGSKCTLTTLSVG